MICSECEKQGVKSTIEIGPSRVTLMVSHGYFDVAGRYHQHDPNTWTYSYKCSNGHEWSESSRYDCWCGWPTKEQVQ